MDAKVTVEFVMENVCDKEDLKDTKMSFTEMVKFLILDNGLLGVIPDKGKCQVVNIERVK